MRQRQLKRRREIGPHLARDREQLKWGGKIAQGQQGLSCPLLRLGHGPPSQRFSHHAVTALETNRATNAGDRVNDEP